MLIIHKKKVQETREAICNSKLIVITGPAGSGKTYTVNHICKELKLDLLEWIQEPDRTTRDFIEFIKTSSRLPNSLVLVKDLPTIVESNKQLVMDCLRSYTLQPRRTNPLVFILTDSTHVECLDISFFQQLNCKFVHISFNPVAPSFLSKLCKHYPNHQDIVQNANGDIRAVLNQLEFPNSFRDESLDTFHLLGRVLYPKRTKGDLKHDPNLLVNQMEPYMMGLLHSNLICDYDEWPAVLECFSQSDCMDFPLDYLVRGLLYYKQSSHFVGKLNKNLFSKLQKSMRLSELWDYGLKAPKQEEEDYLTLLKKEKESLILPDDDIID